MQNFLGLIFITGYYNVILLIVLIIGILMVSMNKKATDGAPVFYSTFGFFLIFSVVLLYASVLYYSMTHTSSEIFNWYNV